MKIKLRHLVVGILAVSGIAKVQVVNIPDSNFKKALIEASYDRNQDGELQISEVHKITSLSLVKKEISSLEGIEKFENLEVLDCSFNSLSKLDVSKKRPTENTWLP